MSDPARGVRLHPSLHHPAMREIHEKHLHPSALVYPLFVTGREDDRPIKGFAPNMQWGAGKNGKFSTLVDHLKHLQSKGLRSVMLFGVVEHKDHTGSMADRADTPVIVCMQALRAQCPWLMLMADVCLCEYTDHGHCAPLLNDGSEKSDRKSIDSVNGDDGVVVDNEAGIKRLADIAVSYAKAGAHVVCPSDMMDGRVSLIRRALERQGMNHVSIMAYTSKKASCMYSPFRAAVESTFRGNRKRYQQPPGDAKIARRALRRDIKEGADIVLVKPCLFYGDIIRDFSQRCDVPIAAYVVSGEYKMLKDYGEATGTMDAVLKESHVGLLRAGASILITYFTPRLLDALRRW